MKNVLLDLFSLFLLLKRRNDIVQNTKGQLCRAVSGQEFVKRKLFSCVYRDPLPGSIDPVFTPDGQHLIVPVIKAQLKGHLSREDVNRENANVGESGNKTNLAFYSFDDFKKSAQLKDKSKKTLDRLHSKTISFDEANNGVYQSASIAENNKFTVLTDQNGASVTSYEKKGNSVKKIGNIEKLCNQDKNFKTDLPMLSKDGKFVSTYNYETRTTQIFQLRPDGNCHLSLDLGMATGKVSFNKDSSQVTFHVDRFSNGFGGYFSGVSSDITKEVFVLNLEKSEDQNNLVTLKPTTWAKASKPSKKGDGGYYPDFSDKGDIFFLSDTDNYFQFVQVEQKNLNFTPYLSELGQDTGAMKDNNFIYCSQVRPNAQPLYLLGQLWGQVCQKFENSQLSETMMNAMALDNKNCENLVRNEWNENFLKKLQDRGFNSDLLSAANSLKIEDLLVACPKNNSLKSKENIVGFWKKRDHQGFKDVLKQKCLTCHTNEIEYKKEVKIRIYYDENSNPIKADKVTKSFKLPPINPEKVDYDLAYRMSGAINSSDPKNRMPKVGSLTTNEKLLFANYFQEKQLELPSAPNESVANVEAVWLYSDKAIEKYFEESIVTPNREKIDQMEPIDREKYLTFNRRSIYCTLGRKGCKEVVAEYVNSRRESLLKGESSLSEESQKSLSEFELAIRCIYKYETTFEMCKDVKSPF